MGLYGHLDGDRSPVHRNFRRIQWHLPDAHSTYLEVTLQLGLVGLGLLLTIIAVAWRRALACLRMGVPLGWFSLMLVVGALTESITGAVLGQNMSMFWLLVNVFSFSCGLTLASLRRRGSFEISYSRFVPSRTPRYIAAPARRTWGGSPHLHVERVGASARVRTYSNPDGADEG